MISQASVCPWGEGVHPLGRKCHFWAGSHPLGRHHLETPTPGKILLGRNPQADIAQADTPYADIPHADTTSLC